jgi:hypothetical protein
MSRLTLVFAVVLLFSKSLLAANVSVSFTGPEQSFDGGATAGGPVTAFGFGQVFNPITKVVEPFVLTPPLMHELSFAGGVVPILTTPQSLAPAANFELTPDSITNISNLDIDFQNGLVIPFSFNPFFITTNSNVGLLKSVSVEFSGNLESLGFAQTGAAKLTPGLPGSGTFSIPGEFTSDVTDFTTVILGAIPFVITDPLPLSAPGFLSGTYNLSGTPGNLTVSLEGKIDFEFIPPFTQGLVTELPTPLALTVSVEGPVDASIFVEGSFILKQSGLVVPEPGSIVLLVIGGGSLLGVLISRRGGKRGRSS